METKTILLPYEYTIVTVSSSERTPMPGLLWIFDEADKQEDVDVDLRTPVHKLLCCEPPLISEKRDLAPFRPASNICKRFDDVFSSLREEKVPLSSFLVEELDCPDSVEACESAKGDGHDVINKDLNRVKKLGWSVVVQNGKRKYVHSSGAEETSMKKCFRASRIEMKDLEVFMSMLGEDGEILLPS